MKDKKTIFQQLELTKTPFAVCVNINSFINLGIDRRSKDYFMLLHEDGITKDNKAGFRKSKVFKQLYEKDLSDQLIIEFKSKMNLFNKVAHSADGRVYESRGESFRSKYKFERLEA